MEKIARSRFVPKVNRYYIALGTSVCITARIVRCHSSSCQKPGQKSGGKALLMLIYQKKYIMNRQISP